MKWRDFLRTRWRPALRGFGLGLLLLGPLVSVEYGARESLRLLMPQMRKFHVAADTKRLLLRGRCPDALALGTSQTDQTLTGRMTRGRRIGADGERVRRLFDFGVAGVRAVNMYMMWRHLHARGCDPRYVFVEVTPTVINGKHQGELHDAPFLGLGTLLDLPDGFIAQRGYTLTRVAELVTYERLFIQRRREQIVKTLAIAADVEELFVPPSRRGHAEDEDDEDEATSTAAKTATLPKDGKLTPLLEHSLTSAKRLKRAKQRAYAPLRQGKLEWEISATEIAAIHQLIDEASEAGSRVIVHTPPATQIYRDIVEEVGARDPWCAAVGSFAARDGVEWFNEYSAIGYEDTHYHDWIHLNIEGAELYVERLFSAAVNKDYPRDPYCD